MNLKIEIIVFNEFITINTNFAGHTSELTIPQAEAWVVQLNSAIGKAKSIKDILVLK